MLISRSEYEGKESGKKGNQRTLNNYLSSLLLSKSNLEKVIVLWIIVKKEICCTWHVNRIYGVNIFKLIFQHELSKIC